MIAFEVLHLAVELQNGLTNMTSRRVECKATILAAASRTEANFIPFCEVSVRSR
jgi:hypothetical protein